MKCGTIRIPYTLFLLLRTVKADRTWEEFLEELVYLYMEVENGSEEVE